MKRRVLVLWLCTCALCTCNIRAQQKNLSERILAFAAQQQATVGVAVMTDSGNLLLCNDTVRYPLLSVFKFHVALAVLHKMDRLHILPDSVIHVSASQMHENTYSPLRDKFPRQDIAVSLRELLEYSLMLSDNNACDVLIAFSGGIDEVDRYIRTLGISHFRLTDTEHSMHCSNDPYGNWSYPSDMVRLLKVAVEKKLFAPVYYDLLWETLRKVRTGMDKLKGGVPPHTVVWHKTGSSDRNETGMKAADNDAGIIQLPDGRKYYIVVFVMNSYESDSDNAAIISTLSRMVYEDLLQSCITGCHSPERPARNDNSDRCSPSGSNSVECRC